MTESPRKTGSASAVAKDGWSDVLLVEKPEPTVTYRTDRVVYEESLTKGQVYEESLAKGQVCETDGFTLMKQGVTVRLEGALISELLLFEDASTRERSAP